MIEDLKNRKASGPDEIHNELIKYGGEELTSQLVTLFQNVLNSGTIPSEEKYHHTSIQEGRQKRPENYREITLLNVGMKLFTRISSA